MKERIAVKESWGSSGAVMHDSQYIYLNFEFKDGCEITPTEEQAKYLNHNITQIVYENTIDGEFDDDDIELDETSFNAGETTNWEWELEFVFMAYVDIHGSYDSIDGFDPEEGDISKFNVAGIAEALSKLEYIGPMIDKDSISISASEPDYDGDVDVPDEEPEYYWDRDDYYESFKTSSKPSVREAHGKVKESEDTHGTLRIFLNKEHPDFKKDLKYLDYLAGRFKANGKQSFSDQYTMTVYGEDKQEVQNKAHDIISNINRNVKSLVEYRNDKIIEESLQNEDGWSDEIVDILEPPIEEVEELAYELRNTVRGAKTTVNIL